MSKDKAIKEAGWNPKVEACIHGEATSSKDIKTVSGEGENVFSKSDTEWDWWICKKWI